MIQKNKVLQIYFIASDIQPLSEFNVTALNKNGYKVT